MNSLPSLLVCCGRLWDDESKSFEHVNVDDFFPCDKDSKPLFAAPNGDELWVSHSLWTRDGHTYHACSPLTSHQPQSHSCVFDSNFKW